MENVTILHNIILQLKKLFSVPFDRFNWSPLLHGLCCGEMCLDNQNTQACYKRLKTFLERKVYRY